MSATIQLGNELATFNGGRWIAKNRDLARRLNALLPEGGFSPSDPAPDRTAANAAVRAMGAVILSVDNPEPFEDDVIY